MRAAGGTISRAAMALAALLALSGCGDRRITAAEYNGRQEMGAGRAADAAREYRAALTQAQKDGNASAIATAGTNLAIAELAANQLPQALADARNLQAELARRGHAPPPTLGLVIATALYRQGSLSQAGTAARQVAAGRDEAVALRGRFLMGLIAAEQHDTTGLLAASLVLAPHHDPLSIADTWELSARLSLARGDAQAARTRALEAVKLRTQLQDPRGVARCEAVAAEASLAAHATAEAATLYLKAGEGEAAVGDNARAREWLGKAKSLTADAHVREEAMAALASLGG